MPPRTSGTNFTLQRMSGHRDSHEALRKLHVSRKVLSEYVCSVTLFCIAMELSQYGMMIVQTSLYDVDVLAMTRFSGTYQAFPG